MRFRQTKTMKHKDGPFQSTFPSAVVYLLVRLLVSPCFSFFCHHAALFLLYFYFVLFCFALLCFVLFSRMGLSEVKLKGKNAAARLREKHAAAREAGKSFRTGERLRTADERNNNIRASNSRRRALAKAENNTPVLSWRNGIKKQTADGRQ